MVLLHFLRLRKIFREKRVRPSIIFLGAKLQFLSAYANNQTESRAKVASKVKRLKKIIAQLWRLYFITRDRWSCQNFYATWLNNMNQCQWSRFLAKIKVQFFYIIRERYPNQLQKNGYYEYLEERFSYTI